MNNENNSGCKCGGAGNCPDCPNCNQLSYTYYQPNPARKSVGDCTVRALSKALGQTWEETYAGLALEGFLQGDLLHADVVWGNYLRRHGFQRHFIPDDGLGDYTVADFTRDNPSGVFVLSMPGHHVVTVEDGVIYDSWDSSGAIPSYYWTKEI